MQLDGATDRLTTLRLRSRLRARQPPSRSIRPRLGPPPGTAAAGPRPGAVHGLLPGPLQRPAGAEGPRRAVQLRRAAAGRGGAGPRSAGTGPGDRRAPVGRQAAVPHGGRAAAVQLPGQRQRPRGRRLHSQVRLAIRTHRMHAVCMEEFANKDCRLSAIRDY